MFKKLRTNKMNVWGIMFALLLTCAFIMSANVPAKAVKREGNGKYTFTVATYNIAGLPRAYGNGLGYHNTPEIGDAINRFDLVGVQEDFSYHDVLLERVRFPFYTKWSGDVPIANLVDGDIKNFFKTSSKKIGDGLNLFSRFPIKSTKRIAWDKTYGLFNDGADEMIPKGFSHSIVEFAPTVYVHVLNLHADAGMDQGSNDARGDNMKQLGRYIKQNCGNDAVIVMGDTNAYHHRPSDDIKRQVLDPNGLTDPWIELVRNGDHPALDPNWRDRKVWQHDEEVGYNRNSLDYEPVDKVFYRSGTGINFQALTYQPEESFVDNNGKRLSDHYCWSVKFEYEILNGNDNTHNLDLTRMPVKWGYNGYGPVEINQSVGGPNPYDGNTMSLNDEKFSVGLGVHAPSELEYNLGGEYRKFTAKVGIDDESGGGRLSFEVWGDGRRLYSSGEMDKWTPTKDVVVDVTGVNKLSLRVYDLNGNKCDHANWIHPTVSKTPVVALTYLTNLQWRSAVTGWGSIGMNKSANGSTLRLNDKDYSNGIGVHAYSELVYNNSQGWTRFKSYAGIDDRSNGGSLTFEVWGDNRKLYDSGMMNKYSQTKLIDIDISNVSVVKLIVRDGGNGNKCDWGDWIEPRFE